LFIRDQARQSRLNARRRRISKIWCGSWSARAKSGGELLAVAFRFSFQGSNQEHAADY
jgi:hypothetical protein